MSDSITSFDEFFDREYDPVVRSLTLVTGDRARAEDAAQEAFARALRRWDRVGSLDRPGGWVVIVATNVLRRWFATEEKRVARFVSAGVVAQPDRPAGGASPDPGSAVVLAATLRDALSALPPRQRATVVLRYLCDLSTDEVAEALGCAPGTVKSALHAALAALRVELTDPEDPVAPQGRPSRHEEVR